MVTTEPRYEWRVWADRLDEVSERVRAASQCYETRSSAEVYIVSRIPGANPKVRSDRLDVKVLRSVRDGFQQWGVALKVPFPVTSASLTNQVLPLLGVAPLELRRDAYGYDHLFEEVVKPHPDLADVAVSKQREFYTVNSCIAEIAEVTIAGRTMQTAAVESVDLDALRAAWHFTGVDRLENVSYPAMIRRTIGWDAA